MSGGLPKENIFYFTNRSDYAAVDSFYNGLFTGSVISSTLSPVSPVAVPGPLPLLGVAAAFGLSRRLRRRLRSATAMAQRKVSTQPQA